MPLNESEFRETRLLHQAVSDSVDYSPSGSSVCRILQATVQEWVAVPFFSGSSWTRDQTCVSCIVGRFFTTEPPGKSTWHSIVLNILQEWRSLRKRNPLHFTDDEIQTGAFVSLLRVNHVLFVWSWTWPSSQFLAQYCCLYQYFMFATKYFIVFCVSLLLESYTCACVYKWTCMCAHMCVLKKGKGCVDYVAYLKRKFNVIFLGLLWLLIKLFMNPHSIEIKILLLDLYQ